MWQHYVSADCRDEQIYFLSTKNQSLSGVTRITGAQLSTLSGTATRRWNSTTCREGNRFLRHSRNIKGTCVRLPMGIGWRHGGQSTNTYFTVRNPSFSRCDGVWADLPRRSSSCERRAPDQHARPHTQTHCTHNPCSYACRIVVCRNVVRRG